MPSWGKILTRQRRQKRLSKESRAASRSFSKKELLLSEFSSVSPFLEPPPALSSLLRVSYLACIRGLTVFHISVKPNKIGNSWTNAYATASFHKNNWERWQKWKIDKDWLSEWQNCTLISVAFLEKHSASDSRTISDKPHSLMVKLWNRTRQYEPTKLSLVHNMKNTMQCKEKITAERYKKMQSSIILKWK